MTDSILLTSSIAKNLFAIKKTQSLIDRTTERLATGLRVNSALDNPQSFFSARSLDNRALDLTRRLDGIANSIQTINQAQNGLEAIEELLNLGESVAIQELENLRSSTQPVEPAQPPVTPLNVQILNDSPVAYWRLDDAAGTTATNLGSIGGGVNGTYQNNPALNSAPLYSGGASSVDFDGINQFISIPDSNQINTSPQAQRTVELVFNADTTAGRQVLFEEGATVNALTIYIFNGSLYVTGRDAGAWGPANISIPINAGETYHVAFTLDSGPGDFIGYVNGVEIGRETVTATFPSHSGNIGIGAMNQATWFHDGAQGGNGFYFDGRISDLAIYNDALSATDMEQRASAVLGVPTPAGENEQFNQIMDQISQLVVDANYRGLNLLGNENLNTIFNEEGSSALLTEGVDFTPDGLGVLRQGFNTEQGIEIILDRLRSAIDEVRGYARSLVTDFNVLNIREDFTRNTINTLLAGADDLTLADMNEEGANILAAQVRQQIAFQTLSFAARSNNSISELFV